MLKKKSTKTNFEFNYRLFIVLYIFIYLLECSNYQEDNRAADLNKTIMCPVCPSETIDQSQNILAVQMRSIVEEKVEQGWSDDQIKNFFIERYGASVVSTPPKSGVDLIAWIVPPAVLVITIIGLYIFLKSIKNSENLDD
jgi:cytochrome c-type biogenesis protein CcmH/NrfF